MKAFKPWLRNEFVFQRSKLYEIDQKNNESTLFKYVPQILENVRRNKLIFKDTKQDSFVGALIDNELSEEELLDEIKTVLLAVS